MTTFAIDYDGTWTTDPEAFRSFAALLRRRGHRVLIVTARVSGHGEVERECGQHVDRILFAGAGLKRDNCEANGENVNVWIDDMPSMIGPPVPLIGADKIVDVETPPSNVVSLAAHRVHPGTEWISYCGQCIACGYQALHVAPIPDWAEAAPTPDCHKCGAPRAVLPRIEMPEQLNDGSAHAWTPPPE